MSDVKLYVYDLSGGMARAMSLQLTGRQIDGIWHTSVVVYNMEIFYGGSGISIVPPGTSHFGVPAQRIDMGQTAIDQDTFQEYLAQLRDHYTGDKYHLLEFNCNSFTSDCVGFLTGGTIPAHIKDLPSDFLASPLGQALGPTINAMFQRPGLQATTSIPEQIHHPDPHLATQHADLPGKGVEVVTAPLQIATNLASLASIISKHRATVVFFTSTTCAPCKTVEPIFEELARSRASAGVAFAKVDLDVGLGGAAASEHGVHATPTFIFFVDGLRTAEVKGANAPELRSNLELMIFEAFPSHPHTIVDMPHIRALSHQPILYKQWPALEVASSKMQSFIENSVSGIDKREATEFISKTLVPYLVQKSKNQHAPFSTLDITKWCQISGKLTESLKASELFPLVDFWRLSLLDPRFAKILANYTDDVFGSFLYIATKVSLPQDRNFLVTLLRLLSNCFIVPEMSRRLLRPDFRPLLTQVLVSCLLNTDNTVRTAAAGLAFNVAAYYSVPLIEFHRIGKRGDPVPSASTDGEWETELVSAIVEALAQETQSEEVAHRLVATAALMIYLSPWATDQIYPLLDVLNFKEMLRGKLEKQGFGGKGIVKDSVRKLIGEVADTLCP